MKATDDEASVLDAVSWEPETLRYFPARDEAVPGVPVATRTPELFVATNEFAAMLVETFPWKVAVPVPTKRLLQRSPDEPRAIRPSNADAGCIVLVEMAMTSW